MKKYLLLLVLSLFILTQAVNAQVGITSVPFLQIEPDTRASGMGNTGVGIADNAVAVFWNPAGLAFQSGNQVSLTHAQWLPSFNVDLNYDYLAGKYEVEGVGTFGAHITYLNLGSQIRMSDENIEQGRFNSYEFAGGLSYGLLLNEMWSLGFGARFIHSSLFSGEIGANQISPGSSFGVDLAAMYRPEPFMILDQQVSLNAGVNLSNIGPGIQYAENGRRDPLPTVLRLGWSLTTKLDPEGIHTLTLASDISKVMARSDSSGEPDGVLTALFSSWGAFEREIAPGQTKTLSVFEQFMAGTGVEYWYSELFAVRGGYYFENENNGGRKFFTAGAGIRYEFIEVDVSHIFSIKEDHPLANTTRLGLMVNF